MTAMTCPINPPGHDWRNGLSCRWCAATRTPGEAIVSGLASRRGGSEEAARALVDAHAAEVLAADGQDYPGELDMLRGLVRTLRVVVRPDDADMGEVRRLLHHHAADTAAARAEGHSSPAAAAPGLTDRQTRLLDAIRTHRGEWTTSRVLALFALTDPGVVTRGTARRDLETLQRAGHLVLADDPHHRHYTLATRKDVRP